MNKQSFLAILLILLGAIYVVFFTDWNHKENIQISWRQAPVRIPNPNTPPRVVFNLDKPRRLSSVKVVSVEDAATNKYPHALWYLVEKQKEKAPPLMEVIYAHGIAGMEPDIPKARPEPLLPGVEYRLLVVDEKKVCGQTDFHIRGN